MRHMYKRFLHTWVYVCKVNDSIENLKNEDLFIPYKPYWSIAAHLLNQRHPSFDRRADAF